MFAARVPLYLRDVTFRVHDVAGEHKKVVACQFMIQPFSPEHAEELGLRSRLFNSTTGEPDPTIKSAVLAIAVPSQSLDIAMAPDTDAHLTLRHVRMSRTIAVRKDKEGPVFSATFGIDFDYPDPVDLLYLAHGINDQHFCTFEVEQGDLIDAAGEPVEGEVEDEGPAATAH